MEFLRHVRQVRPRSAGTNRAAMTSPAVARIAVATLIVVAVRLGGLHALLRLRAGDEGRQLSGVGDRGDWLRLWLDLLRRRAVRLVLLLLMLRAALIMIGTRLLAAVGLRLFARRIERLLVVVVLRIAEILRRLLIAEIRLTLRGLALNRLPLSRLTTIVFAAFEGFVADLARRRWRLIVRILRPELLLRRRDHAQIMLGVLEVVLRSDRIAGTLGIAGQLQILLGDVVSGAADLHLRAVRLVDPRQRIVMVSATPAAAPATTAVMALVIAITSPHALVLTVSHGSPVADSCLQRLLSRRFVHPTSNRTFQQVTLDGSDDPAGTQPQPCIRTLIFVRWPLWLRWPQQPLNRDPVAAALVSHHASRCR